MMMNDMKKNELTEQEMSGVAGGFYPQSILAPEIADQSQAQGSEVDKAVFEAVNTAWEVVKHAFEICG